MHFHSLCLMSVFLFLSIVPARASLILTEIFADPATTILGDANGDGISSSTQDEFLEFFNDSFMSVDLSGWIIQDAVQTRHIFPFGTVVNPHEYIVVFGGGNFTADTLTQKSSTGTLSLNNTGDTIKLWDNQGILLMSLTYGNLANQDQSIVRYPDVSNEFFLHSQVSFYNGAPYSPGEGSYADATSVVPEPISLLTLGGGLASMVFRRRKIPGILT